MFAQSIIPGLFPQKNIKSSDTVETKGDLNTDIKSFSDVMGKASKAIKSDSKKYKPGNSNFGETSESLNKAGTLEEKTAEIEEETSDLLGINEIIYPQYILHMDKGIPMPVEQLDPEPTKLTNSFEGAITISDDFISTTNLDLLVDDPMVLKDVISNDEKVLDDTNKMIADILESVSEKDLVPLEISLEETTIPVVQVSEEDRIPEQYPINTREVSHNNVINLEGSSLNITFESDVKNQDDMVQLKSGGLSNDKEAKKTIGIRYKQPYFSLQPDETLFGEDSDDLDFYESEIINLPQNILSSNPTPGASFESTLNEVKEPAPITKNELLGQIIEKMKVVMDDDKSEMIINLKPESLGKVSLKVVTEHGAVTARFVAENQKVKQVLETNMQILKDSLEKQGFMIQGFSVFVGNESPKKYNMDRHEKSRGMRIAIKKHYSSEYQDSDIAPQRNNPYALNSSVIDITA